MTHPPAPGQDPRGPAPVRQSGHADRGSTLLQGAGDVTYVDQRVTTRPLTISLSPPQGTSRNRIKGRADLLDELTGILSASPPRGPRVQVLTGMGGVGKTTIAAELARRAETCGIAAWWISAVTPESVTEGMQALAISLHVDPQALHMGSVPELTWQALRSQNGPWLLVFDNADDPDRTLAPPGGTRTDGNGWLRPTGTGMIVVTSRDNSATWSHCPWLQRRPITPLNHHDGASVLMAHAQSAGTRGEAKSLSAFLGGLPLALRAAGTYLAKTTSTPEFVTGPDAIRTFPRYREAIETGHANDVFPSDGLDLTPERARTMITRTWELSLDLLHDRGITHARPLLRLLSCFFDAPAPLPLLTIHTPLAETALAGMTGTEAWDALHALAGLGLVQLQDPGEQAEHPARWTVTLHPLVRATNMAHPDVAGNPTGYPALAIRLLDALAASDQTGEPEEPSVWPWWQALTPHALHLHSWAHQHQQHLDTDVVIAAARAAYLAGCYLLSQGEYGRAAAAYQQILATRIRVLGEDHPDTLNTRHALAMVWHAQGDYEQAATTYQQILATRIRVQGEDHPDTLNTRHALAMVWHAQGDYKQAATTYQQILATQIRVLGENHPDTLSTRHNLAVVWHAQGEYERAATVYQQVLDTGIPVQGENHPHTLTTRHELARVWHAQGDYKQAATTYQQILATRIQVLGENHPDTLTTRHNLAVVWHDQGDYKQAADAFQQILATRIQVLGENHPHTLATRQALGRLKQAQQ